MSIRWLTLLILCFVIGACQTAPTRTYEKAEVDYKLLQKRAKDPIRLSENTVIVDARAPFDYAVAHIPGSVNMQWKDFTDRSGKYPGRLSPDLFRETRRLATYGINEDTPVVVAGDGLQGRGEEGRLAWTLLFLGVKDVQVADIDALKLRFSNEQPPPRESVPNWKPRLRDSIRVDRKELLNVITKRTAGTDYILDVRTKEEYFSKTANLQYELPDLGAIHVPWTEFFTYEGRPNFSVRKELQSIGIGLNDRIYVISNNGVRSGAVTFALLAMGFRAANFPGGYQELIRK